MRRLAFEALAFACLMLLLTLVYLLMRWAGVPEIINIVVGMLLLVVAFAVVYGFLEDLG